MNSLAEAAIATVMNSRSRSKHLPTIICPGALLEASWTKRRVDGMHSFLALPAFLALLMGPRDRVIEMSFNTLMAFIGIGIISAASLAGVFFLSMKRETLDRILFVLVAFATGTILGTALLDLIPESLHHVEELIGKGMNIDEDLPFIIMTLGFLAFFLLERFLYWFHGHAHQQDLPGGKDEIIARDRKSREQRALDYCMGSLPSDFAKNDMKGVPVTRGTTSAGASPGKRIKTFALLNLVGDALHNFLDGIIIMVSFTVSIPAGIVVTLAVLFHELPQEIGDFSILIYGGFTRQRALLFNFASALIAVLGGGFALLISGGVETFNMFFLAFSGGGFLYIAASELLPELLKVRDLKKSIIQVTLFIVGLLAIFTLLRVLPHD